MYYKLDVPLSEVVLAGGQQYIYEGWYCLEPNRLLYTVQYQTAALTYSTTSR